MYILPDPTPDNLVFTLDKRQNSPPNPPQSSDTSQNRIGAQTWTYIVAAVIGAILIVICLLFLYGWIRKLKSNGASPKYIPTKYLKRKWEAWQPHSKYANINRSRNASTTDAAGTNLGMQEQATTDGVNRNTSVRSVMTLPAYTQKPKDTEEVLGREGERGGIDTVVELPETVAEEEERRESEMESLYQIRQARRREIAERSSRRQERREARARGDFARLDELRQESRARRAENSLANLEQNNASNINVTSEMLMAEHNSRGRDRRVSSVSYAAVGQVKHDGTRVRSESHDSERSGLLYGAAPMGAHSRNASEATLLSVGGLPQSRYRDRSNSAATSASISSFEHINTPPESVRPSTLRTAESISDVGRSSINFSAEEAGRGNAITTISSTDLVRNAHPPEYDGHDWGEAPEYTEQENMLRMDSTATTRRSSNELGRVVSPISIHEALSITTPSIQIELATGPNTPVSPITARDEILSRTQTNVSR